MIPKDFNVKDRDDAGRFFEAVGTICDMCNDGVHCCNCVLEEIRESVDYPDDSEETSVTMSDCCSMNPEA